MSVPKSRSALKTAALACIVLLGLVGVAGARTLPTTGQHGTPDQHGTAGRHGTTGGGGKADSKHVRLVGHDPLQARSAYQPIIEQQQGRFIAYVGHHAGEAPNPLTGQVEPNGTSIVDVTDPANPEYLAHIPADSGENSAQMVQVCPGGKLPAGDPGKFYLLRTNGGDAHEIYDVTDPASPSHVSTLVSGLDDTHKSWWECSTGIAYAVSGVPGWEVDRMLQIFDLSDPADPVHIRDFGLPGSQPGVDPEGRRLTELHEPLFLDGRVYMAYGTSSNGVLQILDNDKLLHGDFHPTRPTKEDLLTPQIARLDWPDFQGVHTAVPLLGMDVPRFEDFEQGTPRDFVAVINESLENKCNEPMHQFVHMVDITDVAHPIVTSSFFVPEDKEGFCERGGRFGSHSTQWNLTEDHYRNRIIWVSYFNAGVRAVDVREPYKPVEVGHYIPAVTDNTTPTGGDVVIQTNNVAVDDRGFVYIVDRASTGMHVLYPTGKARKIADLPPLGKQLH